MKTYKSSPEAAPYYYWFEFLKRSRYGKNSRIYAHFGEVRDVAFEEWWPVHKDLFGPPEDLPPFVVERLAKKSDWELYSPDEDVLVVAVNLFMPANRVVDAFVALLKQHRRAKRGRPRHEDSFATIAEYPLHRPAHIPSLDMTLRVYDLRNSEPELKLWQIGERLHLGRNTVGKSGRKVQAADRAVVTATVSRYLRWARKIIANAEKGVFPKNT